MVTDTASKRGYALILFTMSDTNSREHGYQGNSVNKGKKKGQSLLGPDP